MLVRSPRNGFVVLEALSGPARQRRHAEKRPAVVHPAHGSRSGLVGTSLRAARLRAAERSAKRKKKKKKKQKKKKKKHAKREKRVRSEQCRPPQGRESGRKVPMVASRAGPLCRRVEHLLSSRRRRAVETCWTCWARGTLRCTGAFRGRNPLLCIGKPDFVPGCGVV